MKQNGTILSYIAKSQKRRLLYPFLLLCIIIFLALRTPVLQYLQMDTLGKDVFITEKIARKSIYIHAPVTKLFYTGMDYWVDQQLMGHFYYTLTEDGCQFYVIRAKAGLPAAAVIEEYTVTGRIDGFQTEQYTLYEEMARMLDWSTAGMTEVSSGYYINETSYLTRREIFLMIVLSIAAAGALSVLTRSVLFWKNPQLTTAYRKLRKYGIPEDILADAELEMETGNCLKTRDMVLTEKYLIEFSEDVSAIIPLASVLWIYDHASMRYAWKGKTLVYTIHVVTGEGDEYNLRGKSAEDVQVLYHKLTSRFPNYFYGYSKEHARMVRHIIKDIEEDEEVTKR